MSTSDRVAAQRFDTAAAAAKYAADLPGTRVDGREQRTLRIALASVPPGAAVLDLPSGTGRLLPFLAGLGYVVTEADSSTHMLERARRHAIEHRIQMPPDRFVVADVMRTPFADDAFDAVVCNRLFHHFREPDVRRRALVELKRISRGPIIASFFRKGTWDAMIFRIRNTMRGHEATDRIPIWRSTFEMDARAAGLRVVRTLSVRPLISMSCYVILAKDL